MNRGQKLDRLWLRAWKIGERQANGHRLPILHHLALRGYAIGLLDLANFLLVDGNRSSFGRIGDGNSPAFLIYRAYCSGSATAAQNMAMTYFWLGDLAAYRRWLRRAAHAGDPDASNELQRFELRQPYGLARKMRRLRPLRRDES
ncbi:hypothetical protein [Novosphingobium sp.]|uniref:hypothetical protein n=1 Tax=Novosphingobium sp. TaxID=1874826 RepID=UPI00286D87F1|nr:hypothetical protein [Novosphingobium sp.]